MSEVSIQSDIADIIGRLAQSPVHGSVYKHQVKEFFHYYSVGGVLLEIVRDSKHLDMSDATAKRYAREFKLKFPDYIPRALREKAV